RSGRLDPDLLHGLDRGEPNKRRQAPDVPAGELSEESAGPARRAGAAFIDAALAAAMVAVILRVTLGWMELGWADWVRLPLVPLAGFLLLIIAGYLFVFTLASGQTPGKMLVGTRVVDDDASGGPLTMSQALLRSLVALPAVLIAGLGFLPALIGDERALHDRVA